MEANLPAPGIEAVQARQEQAASNDEFKITRETVPTGLAIIPQRVLKFAGLIKRPVAGTAPRAARSNPSQSSH